MALRARHCGKCDCDLVQTCINRAVCSHVACMNRSSAFTCPCVGFITHVGTRWLVAHKHAFIDDLFALLDAIILVCVCVCVCS